MRLRLVNEIGNDVDNAVTGNVSVFVVWDESLVSEYVLNLSD